MTRREPKELIGSAEGSPVFTPILGNWEELMNGNGEELMNGNEEELMNGNWGELMKGNGEELISANAKDMAGVAMSKAVMWWPLRPPRAVLSTAGMPVWRRSLTMKGCGQRYTT